MDMPQIIANKNQQEILFSKLYYLDSYYFIARQTSYFNVIVI